MKRYHICRPTNAQSFVDAVPRTYLSRHVTGPSRTREAQVHRWSKRSTVASRSSFAVLCRVYYRSPSRSLVCVLLGLYLYPPPPAAAFTAYVCFTICVPYYEVRLGCCQDSAVYLSPVRCDGRGPLYNRRCGGRMWRYSTSHFPTSFAM